MQSIRITKFILQSFMNITNTNFFKERRACGNFSLQYMGGKLGIHPDAIVGYIYMDIRIFVLIDFDCNGAGAAFWLNTVENGIFYNWL